MENKTVLFFMLIPIILFLTCSREPEKSVEDLPHFIFGDAEDPISLDPRYDAFPIAKRLHFALFEGLVTFNPETLEPEPGVAENWEISDDGLTYTFHLRRDALWSDAAPVTAHHFVESWLDRLKPDTDYLDSTDMFIISGAMDYSSGNSGSDKVAIRAVDDYTFQFDLTAPTPYILTLLPDQIFFALPFHVINKYGDRWTDPEFFVGNGPFTLENHIPGDRVVVRKSESYWDKNKVNLGTITTLFIMDKEVALEMYQAGELDWYPTLPAGRLTDLLNTPYVHLNPTFTSYFYRFNMRIPPLNDIRVRKALAYSINRRELIDTVLESSKFPAYGLTPPLYSYPAVIGFKEDTEKARELLAEAGYPGGDGFRELVLTFNESKGHQMIAEYCQKTWAEELGIIVKLKSLQWEDFVNNYTILNFEIQRGGWYGHYLDPNAFLDMFVTGSDTNWPGMSNTEYDSLIRTAGQMKYGQERFGVLRKAEEILITEELPIIPFYYYMNENLIDTNIWGGWYENVMDWHPWKWIYKKEE